MKTFDQHDINFWLGEIGDEMKDATKKFGPFASAHEGYAIMLEELDELWDAIKDKDKNIDHIALEAKQVGAMALRFLIDICK